MARAYGSITLVDIGDLGTLSVTPESNKAGTIIYTPDSDSYQPSWSAIDPIILKPAIMYGGASKTPASTGITVEWNRKNGETLTPLDSSCEQVEGGNLKITGKFLSTTSPQVVYVCTVTYGDPATMGSHELTARGEFPFSLVQNATKTRNANISGETTFLYNASGDLINADTITLKAFVQNVDIVKWCYSYYDGTKPVTNDIPDSAGKTDISISVNPKKNPGEIDFFVSDSITITLVTNDEDIYAEHNLVKMRHGAPGDVAITAILTNESAMIPFEKQGASEIGDYSNAKTIMRIYEGGTNITSFFEFSAAASSVTGNGQRINVGTDSEGYEYTISSLVGNAGSVTLTATCSTGEYNDAVVKTFGVVKVTSGQDGVSPTVYELDVSSLVINRCYDGSYSPNLVKVTYWQRTGGERSEYRGRLKIVGYTDGVATVVYKDTSDTQQTNIEAARIAAYDYVEVELWASGSFTTLYDKQTISFTSDGPRGQAGASGTNGKDAYYCYLSDSAVNFPCLSTGALDGSEAKVELKFGCKKGGDMYPCSIASVSQKVYNTAGTTNTGTWFSYDEGYEAATSTKEGTIILKCPKASFPNGGGIVRGSITFTMGYTPTGQTQVQKWGTLTLNWAKNTKAVNGTSATMLVIQHPEGNIIQNGENNVKLQAVLTVGATDNTNKATYQWSKYTITETGGEYVNIDVDGQNAEYIVLAENVDARGSYCCTATFNSKDYKAYVNVLDHSDPLQIDVRSTLGEKLVNSVGVGMIYPLVYRNGEQIDPMVTTNCGVGEPATGDPGEYYYDLANKKIQLKRYNGSSNQWVAVEEADVYEGEYRWTIRTEGKPDKMETTRAIYLDHTVVSQKAIFDVEVTI